MLKRLADKYTYTMLNIVFSSLAIAITILMFGFLYAGKVNRVNDVPQVIVAYALLVVIELFSIYTLVRALLSKENNIGVAAVLSGISMAVLIALAVHTYRYLF